MNQRRAIPIVVIMVGLIVSASVFILAFNMPPPAVNQFPEVTIINPSAGAPLSGVVTINVSIIDEENLTASIFIDGQLLASSNAYSWDTSTVIDGKHTIRVNVIDSKNLTDVARREVTVDNVEPLATPFSGIFKVMVYNIKETGLYSDWEQVVQEENADIIMFVETGYWDDGVNEDFNAAVADLNSYFENEAPYEGYCAQDITYSTSGEAIVSRFPIINFTQIPVVPLDDDSFYDVTHDFIDAVVDINGTYVHMIGGHLKASSGETNEQRRNWESEGIINYMDNLGDVPIMYLSDQNSFSPFDTGNLTPQGNSGYGPMTMMLDPEDPTFGQYSSEVHNFTDVFRELNPVDPGFSFGHEGYGFQGRIDFIVVNSFFSDMLVNSTAGDTISADMGSDHYSVDVFIQWNTSSIPVSHEMSTDKLELNSEYDTNKIPRIDEPLVALVLIMESNSISKLGVLELRSSRFN
ncbi:MAG: Ig-like domain-containing protein [Candidatus Thorarchaeota archaeon]